MKDLIRYWIPRILIAILTISTVFIGLQILHVPGIPHNHGGTVVQDPDSMDAEDEEIRKSIRFYEKGKVKYLKVEPQSDLDSFPINTEVCFYYTKIKNKETLTHIGPKDGTWVPWQRCNPRYLKKVKSQR